MLFNKVCALTRPSALLALMALLSHAPAAQTHRTSSWPTHPRGAAETNRFIVAFELSPEKGFSFTWPYESLRPAPYDAVLMVVETMPRVVDRDTGPRLLKASDWLRVNGRLQKPLPNSNLSDQRQRFEVRLNQGRLRFSLTFPRGLVIDRQYRTARIKLYENKKA